MRAPFMALALACAVAPVAGQQAEKASSALAAGWQARVDKKAAGEGLENVKFVSMGGGFHATMGMANAIFWNPKHEAKGEFELSASFTQTRKPAMHAEGYGLVFNGAHLDQPNQSYVYFLVREGKFLINHRAGEEVHKIVPWTDHAAITKSDADGKHTNTLTVRVVGNDVNYLVNGQVVHKQLREHVNPDGMVGLRVNMHLDLHIADFKVTPAK